MYTQPRSMFSSLSVPEFSNDQEIARARTIPHGLKDLSYPFVEKGIAELRLGQAELAVVSQFGHKIVSGFGSARLKEDTKWYKDAEEIAFRLAKLGGFALSGGGPALMEAWNRGAHRGGSLSLGCSIILPQEQGSNPYLDLEAKFDLFYTRKIFLMKGSHAVVCFPGGYGTLDEMFEVLNLAQKGRMTGIPVVLYGKEFWQPHLDFLMDVAIPLKLIDPEDLKWIKVVDTPDECVKYLQSKLDFTPKTKIEKGEPNLAISEKMLSNARQEFNDAVHYLAAQPPPVAFSGSSILDSGPYLNSALQLGRALGKRGLTTLVSETSPLTRFLNAGTVEAGGETLGFVNPVYKGKPDQVDLNLLHRIPVFYEFIRERLSQDMSAASILFPGGYGTLYRTFQLLTQKQTEKIENNRLIIGFGREFFGRLMDMTHEIHFKHFKTIGTDVYGPDGKTIVDRVDNDSTIMKISDDVEEIADWAAKDWDSTASN